jgi:tRNA1(Val) A37 N6-methylase TrmN6
LSHFICSKFSHYTGLKIIDVCAGSGVIGIEIAKELDVQSLTFIEIQSEFVAYLKENISTFINTTHTKIFQKDFLKLENSDTFDILVCNPPYFDSQSSRTPNCLKRKKCRFITKEVALLFLDKIVSFSASHKYIVISSTSLWNNLIKSYEHKEYVLTKKLKVIELI